MSDIQGKSPMDQMKLSKRGLRGENHREKGAWRWRTGGEARRITEA